MLRRVFLPFAFWAALAGPLCFTARAQQPAARFAISGGRILKNGTEFVVHGVSVAGPGSQAKRPTVQDIDAIAGFWKFNLVRVGCSISLKPGAMQVDDL